MLLYQQLINEWGTYRGTPEEELQREVVYPIGVAAQMVGVSPSTLRMYESGRLIIPYKTSTKMRLYPQEDLNWRNICKFLEYF